MTTTLEVDQGARRSCSTRARRSPTTPTTVPAGPSSAAEPVGDIEKLFTMWDQWGWHRVTFYGDLKEPVFALADAMGWKVIEEA